MLPLMVLIVVVSVPTITKRNKFILPRQTFSNPCFLRACTYFKMAIAYAMTVTVAKATTKTITNTL